ncbi:DNA polymerase III subunit alpha [Ferruginibacter albus]|uniref:DNA polymerase III subunit alpha n=1 Tax=Ferruginibacter albus TaxID=2875540 RepID=UPI001CC35F86|nr:DNA polymerase III subunit alpha [Ferruginibacter albus]UAY53204.1 DNA polymerase III subunit alpha [Ferruginibacter albus]
MYLNCKTYFSLRYGTFSTKELVKAAVDTGVTALALTNINCTCDAWDFVGHCQEARIKPIIGAEIRNEDDPLYILLATNNNGVQWVNRFLSEHLIQKKPFPEKTLELPFFNDAWDGFVIYPFGVKEAESLLPNEYIGILPSELNKLFNSQLRYPNSKLVIRQPVTFQDKRHFNAHRLLRAIDKNVLLSKLPKEAQCSEDEYFMPQDKLLDAFRQYPFIVTNTYKLIDACNIDIKFHTDKNKESFSATKEDDRVLLEKLALDGFQYRYGKSKVALERVKKELKIINELGFNAYFLIAWDIIRYAQSRGFYHVGRGSGANSIIAYCLQITDVDPIELDLYFERFLNPYRTSPPDFDIDFSWLDRDEVIDYVFKRYGKEHVALLGMYSTFKYRAIVRDLGKVFGLPKEEIDQLVDEGKAEDKIHQQIFRYGKLIEKFPNHLSIHPGGMLISEESIHRYATVFMPPKGFPTVQLDMFAAEDIGLYKLDILSQRGLGHIKEALGLIKANKGIDIDIHAFHSFKKDRLINEQIKNVNTIGCFYIESPAMRQLLKKLKCDDYITLVAASSIIRPGVASSGMMRAYIERYHNPENIDYIHPVMKELLQETFGVMVFQEDVIKVAHHFAGLDMGEADILRRAMSGKYRGNEEMMRIKQRFFANCKERQYPDEVTAEIWRQIESFGGYSFSKAHSASFAVESYQSLYLKTYYPKEFMVAVINNFGGFYSRELYFLELSKTGANLHPPCVNNSDYYTNIHGNDVYTGFVHVKSLQQEVVEKFLEERNRNGDYLHLQDFIERTNITKEQLNILVSVGAFHFSGKKKKQLLWEANFLQKKNVTHVSATPSMFQEQPFSFELPELSDDPLDDLFDELEILEFTLSNPFQLIDDNPNDYTKSKDLAANLGKTVTTIGYFIEQKVVPTVNRQTMSFTSFLDVDLDWIDTVHFPEAFRNHPVKGRGFYKITGKVVEDFGVFAIEVHKLYKLGYKKRKYANL